MNLALISVTHLYCKFGPIAHESGGGRPSSGTCVINEGPAGKSSDTHSLADSAAGWTGSWQIGQLIWG